jgi:hypothetical protein
MAHETFISHSSQDKIVADAITAALEQADIRCWIAPRDIRPGDSWGGAIVTGIEESRVMVVIFSAKSNDSKQVMREVERAVQNDVVVVPFRIEDVKPTKDMEYFLSSTHWLDAMSPEMDAHLQELTKTVSNILEREPDEKSVAKASKNAAAAMLKAGKKENAGQAKSASGLKSKLTGVLTGAAVVAVLVIAGFFILGGDGDDDSKSASSSTVAEPKEAGDIRLKFEDTVRGGAELSVSWSGDSASRDSIVVVAADAADNVRTGAKRVEENESVTINVPDEPGDYEVRYFDAASNSVIAKSDLTVALPEISMTAPASGMAGSEIDIEWTGPNDRSDHLTIAEQRYSGNEYLMYSAIAKGSPTSIRLPDVGGEYQLRYISGGDKAIWKTQNIEVITPEVTIEALPTQVAGSEVDIKWKGPANKSDYIDVAQRDSEGDEYLAYAYVKPNKEAKLRLPAEAGDYVVRYISGQSKQIWASVPVTVEMAEVSIVPPSNVRVGDEVRVDWQGPANRSDYLSIATIGSEGGTYESYKYIKPGKKVELSMPQEPGQYEIRYISAVTSAIWFAATFEVLPRTESLTAADQVVAGELLNVKWTENGHRGQYVGIFPADSPDDVQYTTYASTVKKTNNNLRAPAEPGDYEIRYMSGGAKKVWARKALKVIAK